MKTLKLKVCGMKHPENIKAVAGQLPDLMGFIFYEKSPRFVNGLSPSALDALPTSMERVGVFVNETKKEILRQADRFGLTHVQLHGDEGVALVAELQEAGLKVIKVFRVSDTLPKEVSIFDGLADLFLFDTDTKAYGGSGKQFDWNLLKEYNYQTPYLLSGGIREEDIKKIKAMKLDGLVGIDVNSKFEIEPGLKDVERVNRLKKEL